ncbi:hypothetical protein [Moorena sp. SIO3H5]|uniref:hypothetical protein n=1 Tax=Moorena sp. SIO3H5 TaxID=2607834 RepID=UPI0013B7FA5D|nr:hypothetical protein [Moorena sp. SIO3H5]NEO72005.1 hypothetical protein [Moorena sp. SIO3H5]
MPVPPSPFHSKSADVDVGWAVQQTNQYSSGTHPKALPTNCPPQQILTLARCQFYA